MIALATLFGKEVIIDYDDKSWWLDGMIASYHLKIEDILLLKHDKKLGIEALIAREFGADAKKSIKWGI